MGVKWTKDQKKVIDLRHRNILVSAAAGSGKTAVLVERIITMLMDEEHPMDVDKLLVVTFTEAAAAEMKERIRDAIEKKLLNEPENEHLSRQATLIHNAQITTIHSFCLSVIRDHFHAIDLDPAFRVGEEGELKLLRHDVLSDLLEEKYQEKSERFENFVSAYGGGRSDKKIEEFVFKIYDYSRSYPQPEKWLSDCVKVYDVEKIEDIENAPYIDLIKEKVSAYLADAREILYQGLELCRRSDGPAAYETTLAKDLQVIEHLMDAKTYQEMSETFSQVTWARLATNKDKSVSELLIKQVKDAREQVKKLIKTIGGQYFYASVDDIIEDLKICKEPVSELASLVIEFGKAFEEKKRERNMIDFSDMEQYALRILVKEQDGSLVPSQAAREYQEHFEEIMIDEYQDSNLIQEAILTSVSGVDLGNYNIFMVGDVKQSIYRFRLSRPELFMEKYNKYDVNDSVTQRIDLHKNFRSRKQVLDSVNCIFRQIMARNLGGIDYDDQAALYVGAEYPESEELDNRTELILYNNDAENEEASKVADKELEARGVALRIKELLEKHQVKDKETGALRPVRYSDIVILVRSIANYADVFSEVLSNEGIPNYTGTREGYFGTQEIGVLLDYLRILDNKCQDIPLAAVLTSSFGGVSQEELAQIRSAYPDKSFYEAVATYVDEKIATIKQKDDDLSEGSSDREREAFAKLCRENKVVKCMTQIDEFRKRVPYTSIHELLWQIFDETGYEDYVSAMPGGEQRKANLQVLIQKARSFESTSYKGLFHFIRYIEQLQKYNVDYGEASIEDEQSDSVRIMTIHKSKGLEFPIVFVCGAGKRMNLQDASSAIVFHSKLGIGMDAMNIKLHTKSPSLIKKVIQREELMDTWAEELRVLYVALTRAKEKLIITGAGSNLENKIDSYMDFKNLTSHVAGSENLEVLPYYLRTGVSTYLDWLIPAVTSLPDESIIFMQMKNAEEIVTGEIKQIINKDIHRWTLENWNTEITYNKEVSDSIEEQFGFEYPFAGSENKRMKYTVSELKKRIRLQEMAVEEVEDSDYEEPVVEPLVPQFLQEEQQLTGALRGTAYHRVMELIKYEEISADFSEKNIREELKKFVGEGKISENEAECIKEKEILEFTQSESGKRMILAAKAQRLYKEQPFVLGIPESEVEQGESSDELILVQGIVDVYFEEADGLVLLDYKTDRVRKKEELVERYHGQLDYYARALEQITGKRVKEKIIYSFCLHTEIFL